MPVCSCDASSFKLAEKGRASTICSAAARNCLAKAARPSALLLSPAATCLVLGFTVKLVGLTFCLAFHRSAMELHVTTVIALPWSHLFRGWPRAR